MNNSFVPGDKQKWVKNELAWLALTYGMRGPIDNLWHTFIIFTHEYHCFCEQVARRYIHHVPTKDNEKDGTRPRENYQRFLNDYEAQFEEKPPIHLWPRFSKQIGGEIIDCSNSCGCSPGGSCDGNSCGDKE